MPPATINIQTLIAALRKGQSRTEALEKQLSEMQAVMRQVNDAPKWVEEIPGHRSPYIATIDIQIPANSTSKAEGVHTVSTDGPFQVIGIGMYFMRTSFDTDPPDYSGIWMPATTVAAKTAADAGGRALGFLGVLDSPILGSFDVEFAESGSGRNWQNNPFSSGLFNPYQGCTYILPVGNLIGRASVITARVTPTIPQEKKGKVQIQLLGYKVVQGDTYQP